MKEHGTAHSVPNLLLVGEEESVDAVALALRSLRAGLRRRPGLEGLKESWREDYLGVILADLGGPARPWRDVADPVPDQEIRRTCRRLLRSSDQIDEKTLSISVDSGHLTFRGSARDRRELGRLLALAANIRGVRDVKLDVVTSKERKKLDRKAASRLVKIVEDVFPGEQVRLTFFGGVAVLSGKVGKLRARRAIEEFLAGDPLVERVVNKLEVES